jgi:hypothetical protein
LQKRSKKPEADPKDEEYKQLRIDMLATSTKEDKRDEMITGIYKRINKEGISNVNFVENLQKISGGGSEIYFLDLRHKKWFKIDPVLS